MSERPEPTEPLSTQIRHSVGARLRHTAAARRISIRQLVDDALDQALPDLATLLGPDTQQRVGGEA